MFGRTSVATPRVDTFEAIMRDAEDQQRAQRVNAARKEARALECANFWRDKQAMLAEKHAEALSSIDFFKDDVDAASSELDHKLKIGYRLIIQQSDARWSREITDRALRLLDHDPTRFRFDAGVTV